MGLQRVRHNSVTEHSTTKGSQSLLVGASQVALAVRTHLPMQEMCHKRHGFDPWLRKIPWRRAQQPTSVFLSGESHGQRSLAGYSL